jgi:hypothetical protein
MSLNKLGGVKGIMSGSLNAFVEANFNTFVNGKPPQSVIDFRKEQCKNCSLFDGKTCSFNRFVSANNNKTITEEQADKAVLITETYGIKRLVLFDGDLYYRGCGCSTLDKAEYYFSESDLEKRDGTGPCPMGKWNKKSFIDYYEKKI